MRTFSEFVENKEQDILKEYIQYCLENNIDIDEGLMDKFKQYGKAAVLAAAPFVAGSMMTPKVGATEFTTKDMGTNTMNVIKKDPSQYRFTQGDWYKHQAGGGEAKFEMSKLKDKMNKLQQQYPHAKVTWDDQTDQFKVTQQGTEGDLIHTFSPAGKLLHTAQTQR
jgi:hypothetical protein